MLDTEASQGGFDDHHARNRERWFQVGELLFPGYLHVISDLHIQLGGDRSPSLWVPGSLPG